MKKSDQEIEIEVYLNSGNASTLATGWPGDNFIEQQRNRELAFRRALLSEVRRLVPSNGDEAGFPIAEKDLPDWTRKKLEPMVSGLLPKAERGPVLSLLLGSLVFVTHGTIEKIIRESFWLRTSWEIANMYTRHYAGRPITNEALYVVGLSEETVTCPWRILKRSTHFQILWFTKPPTFFTM